MGFFIGTPHARGAGYFSNDNTASGGIREEADIKTCPHCQAIIKLQEWKKVEEGKMTGGWCMKCNAPICGFCQRRMATEGCVPFISKIDALFDSTTKMQQFRKLAGLEPPEPTREIIVPVSTRSS